MPSLSELKVAPSFCFAFKIPDDVTASNKKGVKNIQTAGYNDALTVYVIKHLFLFYFLFLNDS